MPEFIFKMDERVWKEMVEDAKGFNITEEVLRETFQAIIDDLGKLLPEFVTLGKMGMPQTERALRIHSESAEIGVRHYTRMLEKKLKEEG